MMALDWRKTLIISLLLASVSINCFASTRSEPPSSTAIIVDVPVRILGMETTGGFCKAGLKTFRGEDYV